MTVPRVERLWLAFGGIMLVAFLAIVVVTAVASSAAPPSNMATIDPASVLVKGMFAHPGVTKTGPNSYTVHVAAFTFSFVPNVITVPAGAAITFHIASRDVVHGFSIVDTDVNTMVIPGYISVIDHTFTKKGTYLILCNEYCGSGHQYMFATLRVV